jgi:hypothetical protein
MKTGIRHVKERKSWGFGGLIDVAGNVLPYSSLSALTRLASWYASWSLPWRALTWRVLLSDISCCTIHLFLRILRCVALPMQAIVLVLRQLMAAKDVQHNLRADSATRKFRAAPLLISWY